MATSVESAAPATPSADAGAPSEDQDRREHDVEDHRRGLHDHAGTEVAGAAQRGPHRDETELQRQRRDEPEEVVGGKLQRVAASALNALGVGLTA